MVDLEKIIWRTSKTFVFGNGYNIVLAIRPARGIVAIGWHWRRKLR
jgi:hypothetical protein